MANGISNIKAHSSHDVIIRYNDLLVCSIIHLITKSLQLKIAFHVDLILSVEKHLICLTVYAALFLIFQKPTIDTLLFTFKNSRPFL